MATSFDYTFADFTVFNNGINTVNLTCEVQEQIAKSFYISQRGNKFTFFFDVALTGPEQTTLTTTVNNHDGSAPVLDECIPEEVIINANISGESTISGNVTLNGIEPIGNVIGPGASTDNAIVRWDSVHGNVIQNSGVIIDDSDNLTGASIDADNNTITNIDDADIKSAAGINATKIATGTVDNTEFGFLNGVTSSIQTQLDGKVETTRAVNTGNALSGGGDLSADRTIELDIPSLTEDLTPDGNVDFVVTFDDSASGYKKVLLNNLPGGGGGGGGENNTASNVGAGGVGPFKQKTGVDLEFKNINAGSSKITITDDVANDEIDIDVNESNVNHDNLLNFVANEHIDHSTVTLTAGEGLSGGGDITTSRTFDLDINSLVTTTTPDTAADFLAIYDTSAGDHKKILLNDLQLEQTSVTATNSPSTSSLTYILIPGMTITPSAGTYFVTFSTSVSGATRNDSHFVSLYSGGSVITHSEREMFYSNANQVVGMILGTHTQAIVTVNGSQAIEARYRCTAGSAITVYERSLIIIKIA
jgi:hypothetical protein